MKTNQGAVNLSLVRFFIFEFQYKLPAWLAGIRKQIYSKINPEQHVKSQSKVGFGADRNQHQHIITSLSIIYLFLIY